MAKRTLSKSADKQQILDRLGRIQRSTPRRWGRMTAHQMIVHLADSFRVVMGEKPASSAPISVFPIPLPRGFVKWVALELPFPWPRDLKTRTEIDQERGGTKPQTFETDFEELGRLLERFTHQPRNLQCQQHPMFGAMTDANWQRWGYLHMDHHLRQFGV